MVSRSDNAGFVQMIRVTPAVMETRLTSTVDADTVAQSAPVNPSSDSIAGSLAQLGRAVLHDLTFETGSASLGAGPFASLAALADYLIADPARRVALVGHTDAVGALEKNVALSKRRAAAVLERLVSTHGVPRSQIEAEGMGYLSPIAPNQTSEGREANRRVEVILLNTE